MERNKLRFENEATTDTAATSENMGPPQSRKTLWGEEAQRSGADFGPIWPEVAERSLQRRGPKSGKRKQRSRLREEADQPRPSERLRQEERTPPDPTGPEAPPPADATDPPGDTSGADTSGQFGPKSKAQRKTEKSKLKMERTDEKLTAAKEKLAAQKPPKKPGMVKKLGRAAGRSAHGYVHGKIYQVEHENVGTEAAHKTELMGEAVGGAALRYAKKRYRNRHSIRVEKLQTQHIKARADYGVRAAAQEYPELQSTPLSRYLQKQRLKRQYAKEAKAATQKSAGAVKRAAEATGRAAATAWHYVKNNPKVLLTAAAVLLLVMLLGGLLSMCSAVGGGLLGGGVSSSYTSQDTDLTGTEQDYAALEQELQNKIDNIEQTRPGYDEYRYQLDKIMHDPHELAALLTALYPAYTRAEVQAELQRIFNLQYALTLTETVEVRYRTETRTDTWTDEDGNTHSDTYTVEVPYNYYILTVTLKARPIAAFVPSLLTADQLELYDLYRQTSGNRPLIFGGGSPNGSPSEDISGVHFVDGTRPGNPAVVEVAKSQVGNVGGRPYWSWYGFESRVEWCACFVSWCYNQMGESEPRFAACTSQGMPWFQSRGQWGDRNYADIAPGDAIFFDWDNSGGADHVGIVIGTDGTNVYTVEGNSGDACKIRSYPLGSSVIRGYGLMNWD